MTNILVCLWIKRHWLKSGYFPRAWGAMGEGRAESRCVHTQREEWLEQHPVIWRAHYELVLVQAAGVTCKIYLKLTGVSEVEL